MPRTPSIYARFYYIDAEFQVIIITIISFVALVVSWLYLSSSFLAVKDISLETFAANVVVLDKRIVHLQTPNLRPRLCFGEKWLRYADRTFYETRSKLSLRNRSVVEADVFVAHGLVVRELRLVRDIFVAAGRS